MDTSKQLEIVTLEYSIAGCSANSGSYSPNKILEDKPHDQNSRWSGAYEAPNSKQWILLELKQLSVLS